MFSYAVFACRFVSFVWHNSFHSKLANMRLSFPARRYVLYPIEIFVIANVWLWINYGVFYVLVWKNKNYQNLLIFHAYEVKWKGMDVFYILYEQIYKLSHPKNVFFRSWLNRIICEIIFPLTPCILWCVVCWAWLVQQ